MIKEWLEAAKILHNGKIDVMRVMVFGLPILLFLVWRLSSHGVYDADGVKRTVERELIEDYRQMVYKHYGLSDDDRKGSSTDFASAAEELDGVEVRLKNISMSGSLFSWGVTDEIGVRFDYTISKDGELKQREDNVYRCTRKLSRTSLWDCGAVSYYLKYL